jgi:radical SAM protein with 4Fe4S-binding SPASM domain
MSTTPYVSRKNLEELALFKQPAGLLTHLDIELTERCNNNCLHCYVNQPSAGTFHANRELNTEQLQEILNEAAAAGCLSVRFTGGEPLLRSDFAELYIHAKKAGLTVTLFTNATLLTPELVQLFTQMPPKEPIEITVYGMHRSSCEAVTRTNGSFDATRQGIDLLMAAAIPFVVKGVCLPQNREERRIFESWAATLPGMKNSPPSYAMHFDLRVRRDSEARNTLIQKLRPTAEESLAFSMQDKDAFLQETRTFCRMFAAIPGKKVFGCGAGCRNLVVDSYGTVYPCLLLRHPDATYNLHKGSLQDALENFFPALQHREAKNKEYLKRCARCFLKSFCKQCPARSWVETGTLDTPVEYHCTIAHAQAEAAGIIHPGEKSWHVKNWKKRVDAI